MIPLSDFKQIVKESLRDAFYTKKETLDEALIGKRISIEVWGQMGTHGEPYKAYTKYPAVLGKNPIPHEKPYRITWFSPEDKEPLGHVDMTLVQFNKLMDEIPDEDVYMKLTYQIEAERIRINLQDEQEDDETGETSLVAENHNHELLLLLEDSARELDLWMENKVEINESMNLYVKGVDYNRYDTLGEICNRVVDKLFFDLSKLPEDQQEYWRRNHAFPTYDIVTPDGGDVNAETGVVNFYISGLTQQALKIALKSIFESFKKFGLTWGKIKTEQSGAYVNSKVIRIPILKNPNAGQYKGPIELNMANRNAYHVFRNLLQFEPDDEHGSGFHFTVDELLERLKALVNDQGWIDKHVLNKTDSNWPEAERDEQDFENPHDDIAKQIGGGLGVRMIGGGLSREYLDYRLDIIWQIANWAKKNGYKEMYVG